MIILAGACSFGKRARPVAGRDSNNRVSMKAGAVQGGYCYVGDPATGHMAVAEFADASSVVAGSVRRTSPSGESLTRHTGTASHAGNADDGTERSRTSSDLARFRTAF